MARRIRWQIVIASLSTLLIALLLGRLALSSASVASPLAGGSYVEVVVGEPQIPLPLLNDPTGDPVGRDMIALIYDGLMRIGADGLLEPALALDYEVDPSGTSYLFHLRRNVFWHDGQRFSADDVVFTLRTLQVLDQPGEPALAAFWQDLLVDRIDDYTVRVTLNDPLAAFPSLARIPILPAHLLIGQAPATWATSAYATRLIGTGPYALEELRGDGASFEANPAYFGGRPYIQRIELRFAPTREAALAALSRGEVTAFGERGRHDRSIPGPLAGFRTRTVPLDEYAILTFNLRDDLLDQVPLRRALAHGLDKAALIEAALNGLAAPLDTPILPGSWAFNPEIPWHEPDPVRAEALLEELGYQREGEELRGHNGQPLAFELLVDGEPRRRAAAGEIARQWETLGIGITIVEVESSELLNRLRSGDFRMAIHSWARLGPDPDPFPLWHSASSLNYAGLQDDQIDLLLQSAHRESELAARSADYTAFQERWIELTPSITLYQPIYRFIADEELGGTGLDDPQSALTTLLFGPEDRFRTVTRWFTTSYREIQGEIR
ncbi:peptide ABC transporter substrate-binding protein [Candidatus Viridilinea mediisalina]|uniref:ABC transporter substrate-binding protein n=1 Tax=Candidatus Viridilinea mediisalina TaxID=2024553 RepID=A0A2A6RM15_9CHLR|nr:peptide ABC transporter substrate-binding protein [Candidatus Viridilinea mediisalina]PDW03941.1 ABC transporter substrate-binding protein [Candidatus Viridilinea mediisalina]